MSDTPGQRLRRVREARGLETAEDAARRFGWNPSTYRSHENGIRGITRKMALVYARSYGIDVAEILYGHPSGIVPASLIELVGETAVGVWQDSTLTNLARQNDRHALTIPVMKSRGEEMRCAVRVADESMNKIFQVGEYAIFSADDIDQGEMPAGEIVYVERRRDNLVERSLRVVAQRKDGMRLECYSTHPRYAEAIAYPSKHPGETVTIIGRVVGRYAEFTKPVVV